MWLPVRAFVDGSREGSRYLLLSGAGLVIQLACLRLADRGIGSHDGLRYGLAPATAIGLAAGFRYWSCRAWVWRAAKPAPGIAA